MHSWIIPFFKGKYWEWFQSMKALAQFIKYFRKTPCIAMGCYALSFFEVGFATPNKCIAGETFIKEQHKEPNIKAQRHVDPLANSCQITVRRRGNKGNHNHSLPQLPPTYHKTALVRQRSHVKKWGSNNAIRKVQRREVMFSNPKVANLLQFLLPSLLVQALPKCTIW